MDRKTASKLIEENLHTLFAWSLSKLYDRSQAEDLTNDIVCAVLSSVDRLERDEAFYGFLWRIAENTLRNRIRKAKPETVELEESFCGVYWETPEDVYIENEQVQILRRELALLSRQYRETTVQYYIYGKSCSEISELLGISREMVKYYLFKTRKILKEGIGMTREFGEKSYNPQVFQMDFWGEKNTYSRLFERRLPGNILLSAYDKPVTIGELTVELGVAAVYLEDEIAILEEHDFLRKAGDKYQTNIVIFTEEYRKKIKAAFPAVYERAAGRIGEALERTLPQLKNMDFYGKDYDDNRLRWTFANYILYQGFCMADSRGKEKFGAYPLLSNGTHGFVYGYDYDDEAHPLNGIYGFCCNKEGSAWVSIENYRVIEKCQNLQPTDWQEWVRGMTDAVLFKEADDTNEQLIREIEEGIVSCEKGRLSPDFPVFGRELFESGFKELLGDIIGEMADVIEKVCEEAAEILTEYVPAALKGRCGQMACIEHQLKTMAFIVEAMVKKGLLVVPRERVNLCVFGVDMR